MKITINNEEVLCDKNIKITEEMLNTSSTILNNVFPKDWDNEKKYTNYYYPKDYSQCLIWSDKYRDITIGGKSIQNGTPTPTNPVPVESMTGNTSIEIDNENYQLNLGSIELRSINIENLFNKDTVVTGKRLDGANGNYYNDAGYFTSDFIKVVPGEVYIKNSPTADAYHRICFYTSDDYTTFISASNNNNPTVPTSCNYIRFCGKETELNTTQFEKGNAIHNYTPFGVPLPIVKDSIYNSGEDWFIKREVGKTVLNGTESGVRRETSDTTKWRFCLDCSGVQKVSSSTQFPYIISDKFITGTLTAQYNRANCIGTGASTNTYYRDITIYNDDINSYTFAQFQTWLSNNNIEVYYQLATPTVTQITDENLLHQLKALNHHLLFSGVAKRTGNISLNPYHAHYCDLQILDYKALLSEGDLLDFVIADKTVEQAIDMVIESVKDYGFIKGNIDIPDNFKMGTYNTQEKTAYDVFQYISDITQTKWTTRVLNQDTVAIDFYNPYNKAPIGIIESTKQYFKDNNIIDISYNYSTEDYRNKQVMTSNEVVSSITQTFRIRADGVNKTFDIGMAIGDISYAYIITSSDFIICDIITKAQQEQGYSGDIIYTPGEGTFETNDLLANGVMIDLDINLLVPGRQIAMNESEINRIANQNNRKGIISRYENRDDTTSSVELQRIAQSYIEYKGKAEIDLTIRTQNKRLCNVGDVMTYNSSIEDLSDNYMCKSIETEMIMTTGDIFYNYSFTNTYNTENAINYFDNQRNKTLGNISDGETITRNLDIEHTLDIVFFDTEVD